MFDAEIATSITLHVEPVERLRVEALARSSGHTFAKAPCRDLVLLRGLGVEGDAHCGATDQHLFLGKPNPPPNLRQVHLFPAELMEAMRGLGFALEPGAIGENVVTRGVDLLALPLDTTLRFDGGAAVRLTGRRTPCRLVDRLGKGLMRALGGDGAWGERPIAGVMAVVVEGGRITTGDGATVQRPTGRFRPLPGL